MIFGVLAFVVRWVVRGLRLARWGSGRALQLVGLLALLLASQHPRTVERLAGPTLRAHLRSIRAVFDDLEARLHPPVPIQDAPPIHWPVDSTRISSGFGARTNPVTGVHHTHRGVDVPVPIGTTVRASRPGVVQRAREDSLNGKYVVLLDERSGLRFAYCHLSELLVTDGQEVAASVVLGQSGNTGRSTGPHLHFGAWFHGRPVDPRRLRTI